MIRKSLLFSGLALLALPAALRAQLYVAAGSSLHIGAGSFIAVHNGDVTALDNITGTGQLILNGTTPQQIGGAAGKTISPTVVINNTSDVTLSAVTRLAGDLAFQNGHLVLANNNLEFTNTGTVSGYDPVTNRYIVTNGTGVTTKEGLAQSSVFTFPVGRSTAAGDYNQAVVTNSAVATRNFSVAVKNKIESGVISGNASNGITRFWNIYSNSAGLANIALQHNASNAGATFNNNSAYVTQQTSSGVWSLGTNMPDVTPTYTHAGNFTVPAAPGVTSMFSKSDDEDNSITPTAFIAAKVYLQGTTPTFGPAIMTNYAQSDPGFVSAYTSPKLPTSDPYGIGYMYPQVNNVAGPAGAVTDWVYVEVRSQSYPYTVLATRAGLLQTDGDIVSKSGGTLGFPVQGGTVRIAVGHRNHLHVLSSATFAGMPDESVTNYDFTTSTAQAEPGAPGVTPQIVVNGKATMYAGDTNTDLTIDNTDVTITRSDFNAGIFDQYIKTDLNMDGQVDNTDVTINTSNFNIGPFSPYYNPLNLTIS